MSDSSSVLANAIAQVSLLETTSDDWIDSILDERRPRKRVKPSEAEQRTKLEQDFLTPSPTFSTEWLNKLQQLVFPILVSWLLLVLRT